MKLLIGIPTYKRITKLQRCLDSIYSSTYKDLEIVVCCDNQDTETYGYLRNSTVRNKLLDVMIQGEHKFVIGAWNRIVQEYIGNTQQVPFMGFIGLCDDTELAPDALEKAVKLHKLNYPDTDGVVGFRQTIPGAGSVEGQTFKWFGQTLMGRKFIERYKNGGYRICCPDYFHFCQDQEMWEFADSLGRFSKCERALITHYHPDFCGGIDEAHTTIRSGQESPKKHDFEMQIKRQNKQYLWGRDFNLLEAK